MKSYDRHGLLDRMFLRDCAFLIRMGGHGDGLWVWHFATLATSTTMSSVTLLVVTTLFAIFQSQIPSQLNPLTATREIVVIVCVVVVFWVGMWVDRRVARFKNDMGAARRYMRAVDLLWWGVATLITVLAGIGTAMVIFKARSPLPL